MKNLIIALTLLFCTLPGKSQYFDAYSWGQNLAREMQQQQQQQNQQAYNMGKAMGLVQNGMTDIANGEYELVLEQFEEAYDDFNYIPALECMGVCYELGIGCQRDTDWALKLYKEGAKHYNSACQAALNRIKRDGFWPASYRATYLRNFKANYAATYGGSGGYATPGGSGSYGGSSGSGLSTYTTCRICGGSGVCTSCGGKGGSWRDTGYYTGSGSKTWINCPSCNGNKRCFNYHGIGRQ